MFGQTSSTSNVLRVVVLLKIGPDAPPIDPINFLPSKSLQRLKIWIISACRYPSHNHRVFSTVKRRTLAVKQEIFEPERFHLIERQTDQRRYPRHSLVALRSDGGKDQLFEQCSSFRMHTQLREVVGVNNVSIAQEQEICVQRLLVVKWRRHRKVVCDS